MPATATVTHQRSAAIDPCHSGRGHGPLLPSMIHPNGPWLGEGRQAVTHHPGPGNRRDPLGTAGNGVHCRFGN